MSGMVTGETTVDTSRVPRPSAMFPELMPIHMVETTATGTQYSSTMPVTRLPSEPNSSWASTHENAGITTAERPRITNMGSG